MLEKKELFEEEQNKVVGGANNFFKEGYAGAYGDSGGSGNATATGEIINDSSMGVAIPMSWPNYRSYFGKAIEIKYNDTVVLARINDCDFLSGRDLNLQPGVIKAFGVATCNEWGVRLVDYCIL